MTKYVCTICGYIYDEEQERTPFVQLGADWTCPLCTAPKDIFEMQGEECVDTSCKDASLRVDSTYSRQCDDVEKEMEEIHRLAVGGASVVDAMGTKRKIVSWNDILILGAQLAHTPLFDEEEVDCETIIGTMSEKPMILEHPVIISHMSYGALSKEAKIALAKGSAAVKTAQCSGEGGILPEERSAAYKYIFEYVPNKYSVSDENLQAADAIEIKIGQGTKPGMGGHLPADKVTEEIAAVRGKPIGEDIHSPSHFAELTNLDALRAMVNELRERSGGRPVGIKIAAGLVEKDLYCIRYANPDFITIDGRGGATGASPRFLKDNTTIPTIYALSRARAYMRKHGMKQQLIITGGLRTSADFIKALALGADAIAIATSAMMAIGCQQYRICHNGKCPMGIATQDPELRKRFDIEKGAQRLENYLRVSLEEMKTFARVCGHESIHEFSVDDLVTTNHDISEYTKIPHV